MLVREVEARGDDAFLRGKGHRSAAAIDTMRKLAQQKVRDATRTVQKHAVLEIPGSLMQAAADLLQHPRGELRIAIELREQRVPGDLRQPGFSNRFGGKGVRLAEKNRDCTETSAGSDQLEDLVIAAFRVQRQLDLTEHDEVQACGRITLAEYDSVLGQGDLRSLACEAGNRVVPEIGEEREAREKPCAAGNRRRFDARRDMAVHAAIIAAGGPHILI